MMVRRKNGYIALTSVVLMSAILLILAITLAHQSINNGENALDWVKSQQTKQTAVACAEYAMERLTTSLYYSGNETVIVGDEQCYVDQVTGSGVNNRGIKTRSTVDSLYTKRWEVQTDTIYGLGVTAPEVNFFKEVAN